MHFSKNMGTIYPILIVLLFSSFAMPANATSEHEFWSNELVLYLAFDAICLLIMILAIKLFSHIFYSPKRHYRTE